MQAFIKILFEIVTLRKGPDALPHSWLLLNAATVMWFLPLLALVAVVQDFGRSAVAVLVASWALSLVCYAAVIVLAGHVSRLLQALTAIIGCGAIVFVAQVASLIVTSLLLGAVVAEIVVNLLLFWSVYVKGHIVARTISREWYVGLAIAIAVFLLQYAFSKAFVAAP